VLFPSYVRDAGNALSRRLRGLGLRAPRLEEEWRTYVSLTEPGNRSSFMRTLRSVVDPAGQAVSAKDRLYLTSQVPTLILWGRHDRMIPVEHAFAAHEAIPQSQLVIFDDSGHFPQAEEPQRFVQVVSDFVDTTEAGRRSEADLQTLLSTGGRA
jgi:pimeloyl-ACP methyl ester carboxylesterase